MSPTSRCLGVRWWTFAGEEELEAVRLRAWGGVEEELESLFDEEDIRQFWERQKCVRWWAK